jgi:hypothetical protein
MSKWLGKRPSTSVALVSGVVLLIACADNGVPPGSYVGSQQSGGAGAGSAALPMAGQAATAGTSSPSNNAGGMALPPVQNPMGMMPVMQGTAGMMMPPANTTAGTGGMGGMGPAGGTGGSMQPVTPVTPIERGEEPTQASASREGPYKVESYTSGFRAPMAYGGGTIWYPTDAEPPFAIVAVCPGFTAPQLLIAGWGPFLASHGIVTITIDTITPLDSVDQRAPALMDALGGVQAENARSGSPLMGKLDTTRISVMGWSMGGGGTWINAATHPELKSAISLAGHILTSPLNDLTKITVPTLMLAGALDTAILGGGMSQPVYASIPEATPKMIYEVAAGDHNIGNNPANNSGAIGRYGLAWQKVFLEGDKRYRKFLLEEGPGASDFRTNVK